MSKASSSFFIKLTLVLKYNYFKNIAETITLAGKWKKYLNFTFQHPDHLFDLTHFYWVCDIESTSIIASANAFGASCGKLCPIPPVRV